MSVFFVTSLEKNSVLNFNVYKTIYSALVNGHGGVVIVTAANTLTL